MLHRAARARDRARFAFGRKACAIERFAHIDIAKTGDETLIEKSGFKRRLFAIEKRADCVSVKRVAERLKTHGLKMTTGLEF